MDLAQTRGASSRAAVHARPDRPQCAADTITRPRLLRLLDQMADLTLIVAPAGYGKTTLIGSWLDSRSHGAAWLTLDAQDSDLHQFIARLVAAVQQTIPGFGAELLALLDAQTLPPMPVLAALLFDEFSAAAQDLSVILDDYHVLEGAAIHGLLVELLRLRPATLHLVVTARHDPPWPLASLRLHARVVEIRSADLRFTEAETVQLFQDALHEPLQWDEIGELVRGTEGWVMSLRLAKLYLLQEQGFASLRRALDVGARNAMTFLAEEVFARLPDSIQEFLMKTAVLEQMSAPLCAAIGAGDNSTMGTQLTLRWLHENGIFTVAIDEEGQWYRYHPLFHSFVGQQMRQQYTAEQIAALHRRASIWCESHGLIRAAIQHALAAGDQAEAVRVFTQHRQPIMNFQDWGELTRLVHLFPEPLADQHLELVLARIWLARSRNAQTEVRACMRRAHELLAAARHATPSGHSAPQDDLARFEGEIEVLRAFLCFWGNDMAAVIQHGTRGLALLPPAARAVRGLAILFVGLAYQAMGDLPAAYGLYDDLARLYGPDDPLWQVHILGCQSFICATAGDLHALRSTTDQLLASGLDAGWTEYAAAARFFRAMVDYFHNNLDAVEAPLAEILAHRYQVIPRIYFQAACMLAMTYQAQHRPDDANAVVTRAQACVEEAGNMEFKPVLQALTIELALRQGRLHDAIIPRRELTPPPVVGVVLFYEPLVTLIRLCLVQNTRESLQEAADHLERLEEFAATAHGERFLAEVLALKARYWQVRGDDDAAAATLERALRLAEPGGNIRIFADQGAAIDGLLVRMQQQGVAPLLVAAIRAALAPAPVAAPSTLPYAAGNIAILLTFREQEVLRLIGKHLTNQEIAKSLSISLETVKRHSMNIYRKLEVKNRRAAASYARELPVH